VRGLQDLGSSASQWPIRWALYVKAEICTSISLRYVDRCQQGAAPHISYNTYHCNS